MSDFITKLYDRATENDSHWSVWVMNLLVKRNTRKVLYSQYEWHLRQNRTKFCRSRVSVSDRSSAGDYFPLHPSSVEGMNYVVLVPDTEPHTETRNYETRAESSTQNLHITLMNIQVCIYQIILTTETCIF